MNRWKLCAAFFLISTLVLAADVTGKWVGETIVFNLKADGSRLSGNVSTTAGKVVATISNGKIEGGQISFSATTQYVQGNSVTTKYTGRVVGDTLQLQAGSGVTITARRCPPDCPK